LVAVLKQLEAELAARYRLERELGRGGMATVYLAQDLRHDRPVALKVLHPELANTLGPERFQREIKLAARLQHPHILTLLDSGAAAGQLWFTMPYVDGESLRDRLTRETQLPVAVAVRIGTDAARALEYAHEHGIIHRDIKPENLLLTKDGSTVVTDFGIAQALGQAGGERLTETGMLVGTPAYMSPEQAAGDQHLDARTDVYSLGTVLYEMLAGEPPFTGGSVKNVMIKRITDPVPSLRRLRPSVPPALDALVTHALAPTPADRCPTATVLRQELERLGTLGTSVPERQPDQSDGLSDHESQRSSAGAVPPTRPGSSRFQTLVTDLRRWRAAKIAVVYAGIAYAVVEAASVVLPALNAPAWVLTLLVVLAFFGFPITLVVAWALSPAVQSGAHQVRTRLRGTRRVVVGLGVSLGLLAAARAAFLWREHAADTAGQPAESAAADPISRTGKMLAVLPFENLGRSEDEYFADGVTDEVRGKLSALPGVKVIARSSSVEYKKTRKKLQQIGPELGVHYLLTATVRWQKRPDGTSRVRVNPELVWVEPGAVPTTKWQQGFDAALTDVFQVQADIAGQVAQALNVALGDSTKGELATAPTRSLPAYDAYLQARDARRRSRDPATMRRAIRLYEYAIAQDSGFVQAWAELSRTETDLYFNSSSGASAGVVPAAVKRAAERAVALGPNRPDGHSALGFYYQNIEKDALRAAAEFALGLSTAPNDVGLLAGVADVEWSLGRSEEAVTHYGRLTLLDPRSAGTFRRFGEMLLWLRRYPEARRAYDRALALVATDVGTREQRAMVDLAEGNLAAARAVLRRAPPEVDPRALAAFVATYWDLGWALDEAGQRLVLTLDPEQFDGDRLGWGLALAQMHAIRGNASAARAYADSARLAAVDQLRTSQDAQLHVLYGTALAYLGRRDEAMHEGERSVALMPISKDHTTGSYLQHQLARIYILVGEREKALDQLAPLLKIPYYLSPGWLKIDPTFAPLRGTPRFERLVNGS
jgi:TolB-like protein